MAADPVADPDGQRHADEGEEVIAEDDDADPARRMQNVAHIEDDQGAHDIAGNAVHDAGAENPPDQRVAQQDSDALQPVYAVIRRAIGSLRDAPHGQRRGNRQQQQDEGPHGEHLEAVRDAARLPGLRGDVEQHVAELLHDAGHAQYQEHARQVPHLPPTEDSGTLVVVARQLRRPGVLRQHGHRIAHIENDHPEQQVAARCLLDAHGAGHENHHDAQHQNRDGKHEPVTPPAVPGTVSVRYVARQRIGDDVPDARQHEHGAYRGQPQAHLHGIERRQVDRDRRAQRRQGQGGRCVSEKLGAAEPANRSATR